MVFVPRSQEPETMLLLWPPQGCEDWKVSLLQPTAKTPPHLAQDAVIILHSSLQFSSLLMPVQESRVDNKAIPSIKIKAYFSYIQTRDHL